MNREIEPGIMALVIGCNRHKEAIGKIIQVIRFVSPGEFIPEDSTTLNRHGNGGWLAKADLSINVLQGSDYHTFETKHLMPIRPGDEQTEQSKTLELQE
jgi:hypothetical protein